MRQRPGALRRYALNIATIAVFGAFLGVALFKLLQIERQMRIEAGENMLWVLTQSQREVLRFDAAVGHFDTGQASATNLHLRYDLLLSRLNLLQDPPQRRLLDRLGLAEELQQQSKNLFDLEPVVQRYTSGEPELAPQITRALQPLDQLLHRAANSAMYADWNDLGSRLDEARAATWQIIGYIIVILLAGTILSTRLVLTLRRARHTESVLRREKQFTELVVSSSNDGMLAIDRNGNCTLWNAAMEKLIPVPSGQALGKFLPKISSLFAVDTVQQAIQAGLRGDLRERTDQPYFRDGTDKPRYFDLLCSPLRNDDEVVGALMFVRDVTQRHAAARALARNRDELERLVNERTSDLQQTQGQLLAAMQDLERALENERNATEFYRGFASTVSHQFRTPLAIIDSNAQRLIRRRDKLTPDDVAQRATRIRASIARLTRFIEATLDAARLDTGQIEVKAKPHELTELLQLACARQKEVTPERTIRLTSEHTNGLVAMCDPTLVDHILANLLSNAIKYSPPGTPVYVRLYQTNNAVHCAVSDQGVGVPENDVPKLFERFFRAGTAANTSGTGIGLSLSRALARLQGGDIRVATRVGEGSTFTLTLPRAQACPPIITTSTSQEPNTT